MAATKVAPASPHLILMTFVGEIILVIILSELATLNDMMESLVLTFISGLWLVYLMHNATTLVNDLKVSS